MVNFEIEKNFPKGLLRPELLIGVASSITPRTIEVNLSEAGQPSGAHYLGKRYGRGEVGEFVLIEGQQSLLLGRITEVSLREQERKSVTTTFSGANNLNALGTIQLLGSVSMEDLHVTVGVKAYPRLGDRIYSAPYKFVSLIPQLMEHHVKTTAPFTLNLGAVDLTHNSSVSITPERLFGRHCAILGLTGGGKSWTTARIIDQCLQQNSKMILIDATGEFRDFQSNGVIHCHLDTPNNTAKHSVQCSLPPTCFSESDFMAMFEPSGKTQVPVLRAAIRSLRLARLKPYLAPKRFIEKIGGQYKTEIEKAESDLSISSRLDNPEQEFEVKLLPKQIEQECIYPDNWRKNDQYFSYCQTLLTRIRGVLSAPVFNCLFNHGNLLPLTNHIERALDEGVKLIRIDLSGIDYDFNAREIIANAIGRYLLKKARNQNFLEHPTLLLLDEAHNFLGRQIGTEDFAKKLDAFELIAKEGRKYGLNICLATQRPRDIPDGVLSQMGTLIVHRLTNDQDRAIVERACGEIDRSTSAFLPNLRPGEAAIIGTDFPIPLKIQIYEPITKPQSDGPRYQECWCD